jgi:hypothetical protein
MALHEFDCKGYGQIEPSQVWFNRAGMVEAQCELNPAQFASHFPVLPAEAEQGKIVAENGAFLMCDKERKLACIPSAKLADFGYVAGINYSTEKIYNQFTPGRRNFCMVAGEYLPRIGFTEPGMRICTNSIVWDDQSDFMKTPYVADGGNIKDSKVMYDAVKAYIAAIRKAEETLDDDNDVRPDIAPIYAVLLDTADYTANADANAPIVNRGKLVFTTRAALIAKAIGGVYAIVTEAYNNADTTLSFKLKFVNKPTLTA